mgnify:CR=1 FL=1
MTTNNNATLKRRFASLLYEGLVIFSILLIGFLLPQIVLSGFGFNASARLMWVHIFVLLMIYFIWCWLNGGQTLPMKTWKLRVIDNNGGPIRPAQALLRYLAAWPSIISGVGLLWALADPQKQFLHDRIAGTRIIAYDKPRT